MVSLLPSATEILCSIGGESLLVGRSHECDHPESLASLPVLTSQRTRATTSQAIDQEVKQALGTGESLYTLDAELLKELRPDVILTQDLCDVCSIDLETVRSVASEFDDPPRIVNLDPRTIFDVFDDLLTVGESVGLKSRAEHAMVALRARYWEAVDFVNPYASQPEVLFLEWADPVFVGGHWTPGLIEAAGGLHSLNKAGADSRQVDPEDLLEVMPERVIVCPCGYDLERCWQEKAVLEATNWWQLIPAVQEGQVAFVDGNQMFNRPGPRLVEGFRWLVSWLQDRPEVLPERFPVRYA
ncbi:MAG: ABC transporter substrate-binding protein [Planctomycetota bacterium]|nr:ABC transporter substrate-binding protein [Planctomycetota bacterium]